MAALALVIGAAGCGRKASVAPEATSEFYGIEYTAPVGTSVSSSGVDRPSHYPDPKTGLVIEIPTRIEPAITLVFPETTRYFVEIKKPPERTSLEDRTSGLQAQPQASQFKGTHAASGWRLTYQWKSDDGSSVTMTHRRFQFPDSDYECVFDTGNTKDVPTAQRICESLRPKRVRTP